MSRCKFKVGDRVVFKKTGQAGVVSRYDGGFGYRDPYTFSPDGAIRWQDRCCAAKDLEREVIVDEVAEFFT